MTDIHKIRTGFTIVELLIVIIVIAILASIIFVTFNGLQKRAQTTTAISDLKANAKKIMLATSTAGRAPLPAELNTAPEYNLAFAKNMYKYQTYCSAGQRFAMGLETVSGDKFFTIDGGTPALSNSTALTQVCANEGMLNSDNSPPTIAITGVSGTPGPQCSTENLTCNFTGVKHVAFGVDTRFRVRYNVNGTITCSNGAFGGDPALGVSKRCYTIEL